MSIDGDTTTSTPQHWKRRMHKAVKRSIQQMIKVKSINMVCEELHRDDSLKSQMNWFESLCFGIGGTIGAGIFVLSGQGAAQYAGPSVILSFVLTGIVALLAAASFSELVSIMASCGSAYTYVQTALGEYAGFFVGWNFGLLYSFAALTVVVAWSNNVVQLIELASNFTVTSPVVQAPLAWNETSESFYVTGKAINLPAISITIFITVILLIGIRSTSLVNVVLVIFKVIVLLIFIFACCGYVNRENYTPFIPKNEGSFGAFGLTGMLQGCTFIFFASIGFETVAAAAQDTRDPDRAVPIGLIGSTVISSLIYIGISTVMVGLVPYKSLNSNSPLTVAIDATPFGSWLKIVMKLGALAGLTTVGLTIMFSQTRIIYAMAKDGLLPPMFIKTAKRTGTPWLSILISGSFCALLSGFLPVDILGETSAIGALITYIFVHITVMVLYYKKERPASRFRLPCGPWVIPPIGLILCVFLLAGTSKATGIRFLVWTILGQIVYFSYGFWHSKGRLGNQMNNHDPGVQRGSVAESTVEMNQRPVSHIELEQNHADIQLSETEAV